MNPKYKFEVGKIYTNMDSKKFKCISRGENIEFAPMYGAVVKKTLAFSRKIRVNRATSRECVNTNERGGYCWMSA